MLKKAVITVACLGLISLTPVQAQAFWPWVGKQVVKKLAKSAGIKILDDGAEKKCIMWVICAKVANAPAPKK